MTTPAHVNLHTPPADAGEGAILPNLLMFGEVLRRLGFDVGSANMLDLVRATEFVPIGGSRNDFRLAARACWCIVAPTCHCLTRRSRSSGAVPPTAAVCATCVPWARSVAIALPG